MAEIDPDTIKIKKAYLEIRKKIKIKLLKHNGYFKTETYIEKSLTK